MKNPLPVMEHIGEDILHGVEQPFKLIARAERVLATAIKNQPELKDAITTLVSKCEVIGADTMRDIGERGLNLADDLATAQAIAALGEFLKSTFVPLVEKLYGEIKTDVVTE